MTALQSYRLSNLAKNFKTKRPFTWTWRMWRENQQVKSICDYILYGEAMKGKWQKFQVIDTDIDTDHCLIKGTIRYEVTKKYKYYRRGRRAPGCKLYGEVR